MCQSSLQIESIAILAEDIARKGKINETDYLPLSLASHLPRPVTLLTHTERNGETRGVTGQKRRLAEGSR